MKKIITLIVLLTNYVSIHGFLKYEKQTVVLLSFDGFRHDYIERENLKNFKEFADEGVKAKSLESTFVTKTFPNHFTIATGLYEESHGIVSNYMYDPVYHEHFHPINSSSDPKWWNATTPIWIMNEIQFLKDSKRTRKSATIFWPGSETSYNKHWPYYTIKKYAETFSAKNRVNTMIKLLTDPNPVNFIACYFNEPDNTSHLFGPDSNETSRALATLDDLMGYFIKKLKKAGLYNKINVIIVSDHGMANVPSENIIKLTDYIDPVDYDLVNYGTFLMIRPVKGKTEEIYNKLKNVSHVKTYHKDDIPDEWHYKNNRRVTKIFALADEGYYIEPGDRKIQIPKGDHGYDKKLKSMHGIFIAHGPAFKAKLKIDTVKNIDLCALMCHILDLKPHPNNGSLDRIKYIVAEKTLFTVIMKSPAMIIALLSICGIFILIVILGCTISCFRNLMKTSRYRKLNDHEVPLTQFQEDDDVTEFDMLRRNIR